MTDHETTACAAVIDIINRRSGKFYQIASRPDKQNRNSRDIDFIITVDEGPDIAVEHTTLDSFNNQRGLGQMVVQFIGRVEQQFCQFLPANTYYKLTLPSNFIRDTSKREQRDAISQLLEWMPKIINTLSPHGRQVSIDLVDGRFKAWLERGGTHPRLNGRLLPGQIAPTNLEEQRIERLDRAMKDKLPKLAPYSKTGYETLLILDDTDYALSNSRLIEEATLYLRSNHLSLLPDHIYQLTTFKDEIVEGWVLKERGLWAEQILNRGPFYDFMKP